MSRAALIVEDEGDIGEILAEIVRGKGLAPTVLREGKGAAAWVRRNKPDLVMLDLMLPDGNGYQICHELKLDRETNLIPVIMVTARAQHEDLVQGLRVGANCYVTKPFTVEQIEEAVDHALGWRQEMQRSGAKGEIHFQLSSDTRYLEELNQLVTSMFLFSGLSEQEVHQITTAVREMGANAIEWGHRKRVDLPVRVTYRIDPQKIEIVIRDNGPGFNPQQLPHACHDDDPAAHMCVRDALGLRPGGFGILMARGLVDDLRYNDTGNEVRMVKFFGPDGSPSPAANGEATPA
jgi:two-component system OmpR family response regulator